MNRGGFQSGGQNFGGMSGGSRSFGGSGLSGTGSHGLGTANSPSFSQSHAFSPLNGGSRTSGGTSQFLGSHSAGNAASANRFGSGMGSSLGGHHASSLLNHQTISHTSMNAANGGHFLSHHGALGQHAGANGLGSRNGLGSHLASMGNGRHFGNFNHGFNHHGFGNRGFGNRNFFFGNGFGFGGFGWGWGWGWGGFWPFGFWGFGYPGFGLGLFGWPWLLNYGLFGLGYGGYGYGGYGYGGYGGYGMGYGYDPYCYYGSYPGYSGGYYYPGTAVVDPQDNALAANQPPEVTPKAGAKDADNAKVFAEKGETDFKMRDYKSAVYAWKHAVVDDPMNGVLVMMLAQGFFATGQFDEAAGAVQQAMQVLPKEEWGVVVKNYKELYSNVQDFTDQLRALEKAVKEKPTDPALRFLAGFQYAYLGYPKEAVDQLDKGLKLAPRDEMAKKLREEMAAKLPKPIEPPTPGIKSDGKK